MNPKRKTVHIRPILMILTLITAVFALTGCEITDKLETSKNTDLPSVETITREAKRLNHSPFDVLERSYNLKVAATNVEYQNRINAVQVDKEAEIITGDLADSKTKLIELEREQALARLEAIFEERKAALDKQKELFNQ